MSSTPSSPADPARVPVPDRLAARPTSRGLVVPYVTLTHRDPARPVWGMLHHHRQRHTLWAKLCQICGQPLHERVVLYLRSVDYQRGLSVEPGLHPECAHYSRRACPMLTGQQQHYHPNPAVRLARCADPDCGCRYWQPRHPDPREKAREAQPAEAWYEAWLARSDYRVIDDPGTEHLAPETGIDLRGVRFLRLRKIRDAAQPATDQPPEPLAMLIAIRALFGT
ncbi:MULTISPECIES: cell envelope biogenesis protein OmpA [Nocardia]|uniref:cell envelope biogenesis protein OmpA n=1 Tax=Nocardia TaxID=1817 RepID=UPI000D69FA4D|nr:MULTISPECIES: cell envelope biogenesis protein OmpA [Nocardia]